MRTESSVAADGRATLCLQGRFDFNAHRSFRAAIDAVIDDARVKDIHLDLGAVEYLDSSALGMLLILRDKAGAAKKPLALINCRGCVRQVLDIANFGKLFSIL